MNNFDLAFTFGVDNRPLYATFPFMFDGVPLQGISCGISSRFAGDMVNNPGNPVRAALWQAIGMEPNRVCGLKQIHSHTVIEVDSTHPPVIPAPEADGMVSCDRNIGLSVTVADCLPVYLYDTKSGAFGLVHSGWKGTGIALEALRIMGERWQSAPENIAVILGPCIGACCYQVDADRAAIFAKEFGAETVRQNTVGAWYIDLKTANMRLLSGAGVRHIAICSACTFCDDRLGSFRREGAQNYTHMAAWLSIRS